MRSIKDFIKAFSKGFTEALKEENKKEVTINIEVQVPIGDKMVKAIERRKIELQQQGRLF